MLKKMFAKSTTPDVPKHDSALPDPREDALIHAIRERSKVDPLVGAKIGGKEMFRKLATAMKTDKGVHVESLLCALGALAGYACQAQLRAQAQIKGLPESAVFLTVQSKDGKRYFFGDLLNDALLSAQYSVWRLAGGAAEHAGATKLPDHNEMFKHTSTVLGGDQFGIPRVPDNHRAGETPISYVKKLWPPLFPMVKQFCPTPAQWPILYAAAIQEAIEAGKAVIDPAIAFTIVMESAIPMSKIDLEGA